jgi:tripartite-type tricarboxylate transporter receptor subunit TctC
MSTLTVLEQRMTNSKLGRRAFLRLAGSAAALPVILPRGARALDYPTRPIKLVLPFPPGGVFDIVGRPWAAKVKGALGTVIVENLARAGGSTAAAAVAHARPDGYTILLGASSIHLSEMVLREHPLLDPMKDLTTISMLAMTAFAVNVNPSLPVKNLMDLVQFAKTNPGKLSYGSPGAGTLAHLSGELLKSLTGIKDFPHVPYRGAGPALSDLVGGQIPVLISAMTSQVLEFHHAGKLRLLATTNPTRFAAAPEIPTAVEAGISGLIAQQALGLFAPKGTPQHALERIASANRIALADNVYRQSLVDAVVEPLPDWTADRFNRFMKEDVARWAPLVRTIGIKVD